jgi:predicted nucleic acid-binding protein
MPKRVLDTNILLDFWNDRVRRCNGRFQPIDARRWAKDLISLHDSNAILTPIYIEVIAGVLNPNESAGWEAFLREFNCVDEQRLLSEDWKLAIQFAKRIPRKTRPRKLGDCLIRALCKRLRYEIVSKDKDMRS